MDSFPLYVSSKEEAERVKQQFQIKEGVSYVRASETKPKANDKEHGVNIHFVDKHNVVTNNEYPFSIIHTDSYECMYGKERHGARKQRHLEEKEKCPKEDHPLPLKRSYKRCQASRKKGCPARLIVKEVVMYTDYKFDGTHITKWEKKLISRDLRAALDKKDDIHKEVRVYVKYPKDEDHHSVHELGKAGTLIPGRMAWKTVTELGAQVNVMSDHLSPERTTTFYNPKMSKNRMLVLCAMTASIKEREGKRAGEKIQRRMRCLDAFGATGIMGIQWKVHHRDNVAVTVSDTNPASVSNIRRNCTLNNIYAQDDHRLSNGKQIKQSDELVEGRRDDEEKMETIEESVNMERTQTDCDGMNDESDNSSNEKSRRSGETQSTENSSSDKTLTVVCCDASLVMRQRFFDFIHLDPYGSATSFMDSAFSNISNNGTLSITSTDTSALYGKCPQVTLRNYGGRVAKCEYLKELAGRLIAAEAVRAAARCNKGLEVLLCVALEHFVLVIIRVQRGSSQADRSVQEVKHVLHCQVCGQRTFVPSTLTVPSSLYDFLSCTCQKGAPGNTAILLGPVWSGSIYNPGFVDRMVHAGVELKLGKKDLKLLHTLREEAVCARQESVQTNAPLPEEETRPTTVFSMETGGQKRSGPIDTGDQTKPWVKRRRCDESSSIEGPPAFYFNLSRHSIKNMDNPRIKKLIECLQVEGYRASRTHFDPEGVRTNAGLAQFKAILQDISTLTMKAK